MSKATYPLKLPLSIKKAAQRLAKEDGVSLNQWIAAAVAEKVGVVETAAEFFKKRAGKATGAGMMKFLRNAPKAAPAPEDALRCGQLAYEFEGAVLEPVHLALGKAERGPTSAKAAHKHSVAVIHVALHKVADVRHS